VGPYCEDLKRQVFLTELLMLLITLGSITSPFLITALFLEGSDPTHRLLVELTGLKIRPTLSHSPFLILLVCNFWIGVSTADFVLITGLLHLHSSTYWLQSLVPSSWGRKVSCHKLSFCARQTATWGFMTDKGNLKVHKYCEVLSKWSRLEHPIVNVHFLSCFFIIVASIFTTMRLSHKIPMPAFLIAPGVAIIASSVIFFECLLFTVLYDKSEGLLSSMKNNYLRKSLAFKVLEGCLPINFGPGKPFFRISKEWNVDFNNSVADQLISLLISVEV